MVMCAIAAAAGVMCLTSGARPSPLLVPPETDCILRTLVPEPVAPAAQSWRELFLSGSCQCGGWDASGSAGPRARTGD